MSRPSITTPPLAPSAAASEPARRERPAGPLDARGGVGDGLIAEQAGYILASSRTRLPSRSEPASRRMLVWRQVFPALRRRPMSGRTQRFEAMARTWPCLQVQQAKSLAKWRAMVLFPAPAGPSIATMTLREGSKEVAEVSCVLIRASCFLLGPGCKTETLGASSLCTNAPVASVRCERRWRDGRAAAIA